MNRIDSNTVELTPDEQIVGDFYSYLREERGMLPQEAAQYLTELGSKLGSVMTRELIDYEDEGNRTSSEDERATAIEHIRQWSSRSQEAFDAFFAKRRG